MRISDWNSDWCSSDLLAGIVNRVENLPDRQRRGGVLAYEPEALLVLGRYAILQPEQVVRFDFLPKSSRLNGSQPVMHIVQHVNIVTETLTDGREQFRDVIQILFGAPDMLRRKLGVGRFVAFAFALGHAVNRFYPRNTEIGRAHV